MSYKIQLGNKMVRLECSLKKKKNFQTYFNKRTQKLKIGKNALKINPKDSNKIMSKIK